MSQITFHNKIEKRVHAQWYADRTMVGMCVASPGETCTLPADSERYDLFVKNGSTGWELARVLDSTATTFTLVRSAGRYVIT